MHRTDGASSIVFRLWESRRSLPQRDRLGRDADPPPIHPLTATDVARCGGKPKRHRPLYASTAVGWC